MRRLVLVMGLLIATMLSANAQKGTAAIGADLLYGSDIDRAGLGIKMQYNISNPVRLEVDWDYYFKQNHFTYWTVDVLANYMIGVGRNVSFYPLAGIMVGYGSVAHYDDESRLGVDLGAGLQYDINADWLLDMEFKYQIIKHWDQAVISIGFAYKF